MADTTTTPTMDTGDAQWGWIGAALAAHMAWGLYPVLARYLQTVTGLPTFSILSTTNFIVLLFLGPYLWRRTNSNIWRTPVVWLFALIVILRATTNIASTRFTLSIYVQLITQATPFVVILMSTVLFNEKLPRFTIPAVVLSVIGAVMMIGTDFSNGGADVAFRQDWLGIGLTVFSVIMLSTYMVMVRRTSHQSINVEALLLVQLIMIILVSGGLSLALREDWTSYTRAGASGWAVFATLTFVVFLWGNWGQIQAIRHIGAPFVSSLLATRLVSALVFGALLLNERLESVWQIAGAVIVAATVTWYLHEQRQGADA